MDETYPHFCVTPQHMLLTATAPYYKSVTQVVSALYIGYVYAKHVLDILTERVICVCFEILALVYSNASCVSDRYIPNLQIHSTVGNIFKEFSVLLQENTGNMGQDFRYLRAGK